MNALSAHGGRQTAGTALLLRLLRADGEREEYYVEDGLTIGRSPANTIVITDDGVGRCHARVIYADGRGLSLVAAGPQAAVQSDGQVRQELLLKSGVQFEIGANRFDCCLATQASPEVPLEEEEEEIVPLEAVLASEDSTAPLQEAVQVCPEYCKLCLPHAFGTIRPRCVLNVDRQGVVVVGWDPERRQRVRVEWLLEQAAAWNDSIWECIQLRIDTRNDHLAPLHAAGVANHAPYLIWDAVDGTSIASIVADYRELRSLPSLADVLPWIQELGLALQALEQRGLLVGQIDDERIILTHGQRVMLVDWQLSRPFNGHRKMPPLISYLPELPFWSSPRQGQSRVVAVYASVLAQLLYGLLTTQPFNGSRQSASTVNPTCPTVVDDLIARCVARNPAQQFPTITSLLDELDGLNNAVVVA